MMGEPSNETVLRMQVIERLDALLLGIRAICGLLVLNLFALLALGAVLFFIFR